MSGSVCVILFLTLTIIVAQEHINFSQNDIKWNRDSVRNVHLQNDSFNVLKVWERFSKIVELTNATSEQCRRDSQLYLDSLNRLELWALKMFDATAKPPAGILNGNVNQYGDFDECLSINSGIKGKYCLASLQVSINGDDNMKTIDYLVHSGHFIRSNLTDPGHRIPRYSSLLWGICIPSSCNNYDLEEELSQRLSDLSISVRVHSNMCSVKDSERPYSFGKIFSIAYFLVIILLLSLGTILDDDEESITTFGKLLNAFSLKRNLKSMFDFSDGPTVVKGVDACRGINAVPLLITHKSIAMAYNPFVNKIRISEIANSFWSFPFRLAVLYIDSFLYVSGFLNAHSLLQKLERRGTINFMDCLIARWFRLFPLFLSTMLFCAYILPDMNNGPQWNLVVKEETKNCEKNMWKSFLFIHNYFPFEEMCLIHSHQIGIDMQLYVITVPLMIVVWKYRVLGWSLLAIMAAISTILRYLATYWYDISMIPYSEIPVQKLLDMARYSYTLPTHKSTIYLLGVLMAYVIKHKTISVRLSNTQSRLLWFFCFSLVTVTMMSPYRMGQEGYQYEHFPAALFAAFSPILWGIILCASHWAIYKDYAGIGTSFVESRVFKFYNKISYSVYLTQLPIFFYNVGVQRTAEYFSPLLLVNIPEILFVIVLSIITTVAIEMPFNKVHKIYFGKSLEKMKDK